MPRLSSEKLLLQAHARISSARKDLAAMEYLCSGTLLERMMKCGKASCRCQHDPAARHGPYYEWGHMQGGKLVHRYVSPEQAEVLQQAITNYRAAQKLLRTWETQTERVLDARYPRKRRTHRTEQLRSMRPEMPALCFTTNHEKLICRAWKST